MRSLQRLGDDIVMTGSAAWFFARLTSDLVVAALGGIWVPRTRRQDRPGVRAANLAALGLSSDATSDQIDLAWKKLSQFEHPSNHPGDEYAANRFAEIAAAYRALHKEAEKVT